MGAFYQPRGAVSLGRIKLEPNAPTELVPQSKKGESGVDLLSHTVKCNIIGAVSFHGPVRDGKGWDQDAMDTRLKGVGSGEGSVKTLGGMPAGRSKGGL
jgi:hypothetical protein